jgi:hypothetical protein
MMKNLFLLALLAWVSFSHAEHHGIARGSLHEAESYKVEKPVVEQDAQRSVAGEKLKKKKKFEDHPEKEITPTGDSDSEVRYWQYSE